MTNINTILPGFFLDLRQLRRLLTAISRGDRIWSCPRNVPDGDDWIEIHYSNPIYGRTLPNQIIYQFPLFRDETPGFQADETTYVCLSAEVARGLQCGLYIEDGGVKEDFVEDLNVFFDPIRVELLRQLRLWDGRTSVFEERDGDAQ